MPLFPGESDIDTLYHILKAQGNILTKDQKKKFKKNPLFYGVKLPKADSIKQFEQLVPEMGKVEIDLLRKLLVIDPEQREDAQVFLDHEYFDPIRSIIEIEMQEVFEQDHEDLDRFNENKSANDEDNKIMQEAKDFRDQELMNNSFKREQQKARSQQDEEDGKLNIDFNSVTQIRLKY